MRKEFRSELIREMLEEETIYNETKRMGFFYVFKKKVVREETILKGEIQEV